MEYSIGDQIVHPMHGVGKITDTEQLEFTEGFDNYYVIRIAEKNLIVHIPIGNMEELGIRKVMPQSRLKQVMATLRDTPTRLSTNYKTRQAKIKEKLKSGRPLKIAEVIRDLTWRKRRKHLSETDIRLLDQGRQFLASEIAQVMDTKPTDARKKIADILTAAMKKDKTSQKATN